MMTYSQEIILPLTQPPFLILNGHPPMSFQEIPQIKGTDNSEKKSDHLIDNKKFLETSNQDFQTKKISEFAKNSARKKGLTLIENSFRKKDSTDSTKQKKSKIGLVGLLFMRNQLRSFGTNSEIDSEREIYQEIFQRKDSDTSLDMNGESHGIREIVERKISFSNEDFEDMFSQSDNGNYTSGSINTNLLSLEEVVEGNEGKNHASIEAKELFADEIIEEGSPLILENSTIKLATLSLEVNPEKIYEITPKSKINFDGPPNLQQKNFRHQRNFSNTLKISKNQAEKKQILKKDRAIKACIMLEENLRQINETEFSKHSLRKLEESRQLLTDINLTLNQKEGYEHDKVLELLDFVNKMIEMGLHYLKFKFDNRNEKIKKSDRSSNMKRMASSLGSVEHWQSSKEDSQQNSPEIEKEQEPNKMFVNEIDRKRDVEDFNIYGKNQTNNSRRASFEDLAESIKYGNIPSGHSQNFILQKSKKQKDFGRFNLPLLPKKKGGFNKNLHVLHHKEKSRQKPNFQMRLLEGDALIEKNNKIKRPEKNSFIIKQTTENLHHFSNEKKIILGLVYFFFLYIFDVFFRNIIKWRPVKTNLTLTMKNHRLKKMILKI